MILTVITTCLLAFGLYKILSWLQARSQRQKYSSYKQVPTVKGCYPIVGHGITFSKDIIGFVRKAYDEYGGIYRIKVFNRTYAVVSDRSLLKEYFKTPEEEQSLYKVLDNLYFGYAFSDNPSSLLLNIKMIRQTVAVKFDEFSPKIHSEAVKLTERLKTKVGQKINITDEMIKFVSTTSARCFLGVQFTEEVFSTFIKFTKLLNNIIVSTYFMPKWLIAMTIGRTLRKYRKEIIKFMSPEINSYREDPSKKESLLIRYSVDYQDPETGERLTNDQIGGFITCLLYISSENTALGLVASLTDLGMNPSYWYLIRNETKDILKDEDTVSMLRGLFSVTALDYVFAESGRMNTHIFPLNRSPVKKKTIGNYYVGDVDSIVLCEPEILMFKEAEKIFKDPQEYKPFRYRTEPMDSYSLTLFGASHHECVGKVFSKYEIKTALALITNMFDFEMPKKLPAKNYFSPSAFAETSYEVILSLNDGKKKTQPALRVVPESPTDYIIERYDSGEHSGYLIRQFLSIDKQKELYNYTTDQITDTKESKQISSLPSNLPTKIAYNNLPCTGSSNCKSLDKWHQVANNAVDLLKSRKDLKFNGLSDDFKFNATNVQMLTNETKYFVPLDNNMEFVMINMGTTVEFTYGDTTVYVNSGDVFVTDLLELRTNVKVHNNVPQWWNSSNIRVFDNRTSSIVQVGNFNSGV